MQIRELDLKELYTVYDVIKQLRTHLSYKEFEDLIYDMQYMNYKMMGIMDKEELITYAGVAIQTNFEHKRHLYVFDFVIDEKHRCEKYTQMMLQHLVDFAKVGMCENIVLSSDVQKQKSDGFCEQEGYVKKSFLYVKAL